MSVYLVRDAFNRLARPITCFKLTRIGSKFIFDTSAGQVEIDWPWTHNDHDIAQAAIRKMSQSSQLIGAGVNFGVALSDAVGEINAMGKLHLTAQRIAATRAKLDSEADKLNAKLDGLDAKAPAAFDRANSIIESQNADLDQMESEIRQLSNLPDA